MSFALGVVLFAAGLCLSIALHELGHMLAAKKAGMKVRRYYIGFGPTLWSTTRGETEYGIKAIPLGGFCDIAGMTTMDVLEPDEEERAMWRKSARARVGVLLAGPAMNFVLGIVLIYILALGWGIPNIDPDTSARIGATDCAAASQSRPDASGDSTLSPCTGAGPAAEAGIRPGDVVVRVGEKDVSSWPEMAAALRGSQGTVDVGIRRGSERLTVPVEVQQVTRWVRESGSSTPVEKTVGAIGVSYAAPPMYLEQNPLSAIPATFAFTGELAVRTGEALWAFPGKIPGVVSAIFGGERAADGPVSVYGASVAGGEAVERGVWDLFLVLLLSINFFLAAFNLVPVPPLDGGHIAVVGYEKTRDLFRRRRGREIGVPVDYERLAPLTLTMWGLLMGVGVLVIVADVVNPIKIF